MTLYKRAVLAKAEAIVKFSLLLSFDKFLLEIDLVNYIHWPNLFLTFDVG